MKYLCDTHIFLWWLNDDKRLKNSIKEILANPNNIIYVSVISGWEVVIKLKTNRKFRLRTTLTECFLKAGFNILDIKLPHVLQLEKLDLLHQDPFDRMLVAQAISEEATLITGDEKIWRYDLSIIKV